PALFAAASLPASRSEPSQKLPRRQQLAATSSESQRTIRCSEGFVRVANHAEQQ
ncbi:hypothetical protein A2U01_0102399, partial [Trifolium medium]|nr:hypothetical protein [Trifolium medium]